MKFVIFLIAYSISLFSSEQEQLLQLRATSKDLRNQILVIEIKSSSGEQIVRFVENNEHIEVEKNKRKLKMSSSQISEFDEIFVRNFISFKYEKPRLLTSTCYKKFALYLRGEFLDICDDEQSKIIKIQKFIEDLNSL